jgi:1-acyl-sn-glycerol-3-phosphate acyltransferase
MSVLTVVSPGLKVLFECIGKPEIINQPEVLRLGGMGAVIACNHLGWADSLWMAYAVYPRQLRYMSKEELFSSLLTNGYCNTEVPFRSTARNLRQVRSRPRLAFCGAATVALHARVPLVPAFYQGPKHMHIAHIMRRPRIRVMFGAPIPTTLLPLGKETTAVLTRQLQVAIGELRSMVNSDLCAA